MRNDITRKELDSIRFYQGDVRKRNKDGSFSDEPEEGFRGLRSAYKTMNCLMFPGIENEIERINEKKAKLIPQLLIEVDQVVEVYCDIFRAMCKSVKRNGEQEYRRSYRTERGVSAEELKKGSTVSFTSTSKSSNPEEFLKTKSDLTLLEILIPASVPQLDFEELFSDSNLYPQQREILLPPFLNICVERLELEESEKDYRDVNGNPPKGKYLVLVEEGMNLDRIQEDTAGIRLGKQENEKAAAILEKLIQGAELTGEELRDYCGWKAAFRNKIKQEFGKILKEFSDQEGSVAYRKEQLMADVNQMRKGFGDKQKEYKKKLDLCNRILNISNAVLLGGMSLSFVPGIGDGMKVIAIGGGIASVLMTQHMKAKAYGAKAMQRSKTYLNLCDLRWEMRYTQDWTHETVQKFTDKFLNIMRMDTEMSLQNLQTQIDSGEDIYKSEIDFER